MRRRPRIVGLVLLGLALTGLLALIASISLDEPEDRPEEITGAGTVQRLFGGLDQDAATLGEPEAPVTIDLFNDLQCADCDEYHLDVVPRLVEDLVRPGDAQLTYRHFPLGQRERVLADYGALAAAEQERQWQYVHLFFINQEVAVAEQVSEELLERIAAGVLELDVERWMDDFQNPSADEILDADAELALELKLTAEPAAVITGPRGTRELDGRPTAEEIEAAVADVQ